MVRELIGVGVICNFGARWWVENFGPFGAGFDSFSFLLGVYRC